MEEMRPFGRFCLDRNRKGEPARTTTEYPSFLIINMQTSKGPPLIMKKAASLLILIWVCILSHRASAESFTIQGDDCSMVGLNGIVYLRDADGVDRLKLWGLDLVWEDPRTNGGTLVQTSSNQLAIDYNIADDPSGEVAVSAVFTLTGKTITADFTLTAPTGLSLGGTMAYRQALSTTGNAYFSATTQRRHDYAAEVSVFETIVGNPNWKDTWKQHVYLTSAGSNTYTFTTEFILAPHTVTGTTLAMREEGGNVYIQDTNGNDLMRLGGLDLTWSPPNTSGGTMELLAPNQFGVQYDILEDTSGEVTVYGTYTCIDKRVIADLLLTVPVGMSIGGAKIKRLPLSSTSKTLHKMGRWTRDIDGGAAYEVKSAYLNRFDYNLPVAVLEDIKGNSLWQDSWSQHVPFTDNGDGTYSAQTSYTVDDDTRPEQAIAEYVNGYAAAMTLGNTSQPFNLWAEGQTPQVTVELTNTLDQSLSGTLYATAYDFDGTLRLNSQQALTLSAWQTYSQTYSVPLLHTPDIAFVETRFVSGGTELCFAQTNVAVIHDYTFQHKEESNFGIAAYFDVPTRTDVHDLLARMGVRWNRRGDTTETLPAFDGISNHHNNVTPTQWSNDPTAKSNYFQSTLADCDARQNPYWEFCNEWNMSALHTGTNADVYVNDWLVPLDAERGGYNVQIMSVGIAGADTTFLNAIASNGGWSLLDAIAMHPGRGNYTPDYGGGGWKYLGAIRSFKNAIDNLGYKPLWLTEVYAGTYPNSGWKDSYRRAAENVVLTYALGVSEGAAGVEFYQMHDARGSDVGGVNHTDSEYHYGLLYRDGTIKPSLLAFCAIAEALDGASFIKYESFADPTIKGIQYDTPNGNMTILWNRADGYTYDDAIPLDPWLDHWSTHTNVTLHSSQSQLTVIDCIGRATTVPVSGGKATLSVSGAPLIVYGMSDTQTSYVDFSLANITTYDPQQDLSGGGSSINNGSGIQVTGNAWKAIEYPYTVTANTVLEFDLTASAVEEFVCIGMDDDHDFDNSSRLFQLAGWQGTAIINTTYDNDYIEGSTTHYVIPIGQHFTGAVNFLTFVMDDDADSSGSAIFSNVMVRESTGTKVVNFNSYTVSSYVSSQDVSGGATIVDNGDGLNLYGNPWKKINLSYTLTSKSVLEFTVTGSDVGEITSIGLDEDTNYSNAARHFQLGGSQSNVSGFIADYKTYAVGTTMHYVIPIGTYYTGTKSYLALIADDDANASSDVTIRNIVIYEGR